VDLHYIPYTNKENAVKRFSKESYEATYDFVECIAYSPTDYVVMVGNMTDRHDTAPYNDIGRWYKEWFFLHVNKFLTKKPSSKNSSTGSTNSEYPTEFREIIPLRSYYHRHSKSLFWEIQDIVPFGNNVIFRYLLGWMMPPKPSLMKLTQTEALRKLYELHHVVQDMLVPMSTLGECLSVFDKEVSIYPLWLCPFAIPRSGTAHTGFLEKAKCDNAKGGAESPCMYVDIGAYGNPTVPGYHARDSSRRIEDYVRRVDGYQMMYADSYTTK
jgi:delta24-sterol reductase